MKYTYIPRGVCSRSIEFDLDENGIITNLRFDGGCNGNAKGISALVEGMKADDVINRCKGITCGMKRTSCPDQLSMALREALGK